MNILQEYLRYVSNTEPPTIFHRWSFICAVGALLERNVCYGNGHFTFYPNLYVMLMGESGTRKSTAINMAKAALQRTGYNKFSAEQTSKEKYLEDLASMHSAFEDDLGDISTAALFGPAQDSDTRVTSNFIVAGEFNDFIGNGNIEFMSILGNLWDWNGPPYSKRIKTGKSVVLPNPTISLLGGNTATGFSLAFPPSAIGQGFFSRIVFVHSSPSERRIRKPVFPEGVIESVTKELKQIASVVRGNMTETPLADKMLDAIYKEFVPLEDARFNSYCTRRYAQLMKLCIICAALRCSMQIAEQDVILANTMLTHAELLMPKALGEFGKARSSDVAHTVLSLIHRGNELVTLEEIWKAVSQDLDSPTQLNDILQKLLQAGKIQTASVMTAGGKKTGLLPLRKAINEHQGDFVDFSLLTPEERSVKL